MPGLNQRPSSQDATMLTTMQLPHPKEDTQQQYKCSQIRNVPRSLKYFITHTSGFNSLSLFAQIKTFKATFEPKCPFVWNLLRWFPSSSRRQFWPSFEKKEEEGDEKGSKRIKNRNNVRSRQSCSVVVVVTVPRCSRPSEKQSDFIPPTLVRCR